MPYFYSPHELLKKKDCKQIFQPLLHWKLHNSTSKRLKELQLESLKYSLLYFIKYAHSKLKAFIKHSI